MAKLTTREDEPGRVALVVDGAGSMHGVTHTIERIREHGVPGWEVEVVGTDSRVDRRLPAAAELEVPVLRRDVDRDPERARARPDAGRRPLRPDPPLLARARPGSAPR